MPEAVIPGPLKIPVPGTPPISLAWVIWKGGIFKQLLGIDENCTLGDALTVIESILSLTQTPPD